MTLLPQLEHELLAAHIRHSPRRRRPRGSRVLGAGGIVVATAVAVAVAVVILAASGHRAAATGQPDHASAP